MVERVDSVRNIVFRLPQFLSATIKKNPGRKQQKKQKISVVASVVMSVVKKS
jgi:hypothetical protein